jgi:hypothetical protein
VTRLCRRPYGIRTPVPWLRNAAGGQPKRPPGPAALRLQCFSEPPGIFRCGRRRFSHGGPRVLRAQRGVDRHGPCLAVIETLMFKAAVFVVVLTLVGGRAATVLCGAWCDRGPVRSTCYHDEATPTVAAMAAGDGCSGSDLLAGLWRAASRRAAAGEGRDLQLPGSMAQLVRLDSSPRPPAPACIAPPLERRPLSTQLRI